MCFDLGVFVDTTVVVGCISGNERHFVANNMMNQCDYAWLDRLECVVYTTLPDFLFPSK